mmetsp:Transcript_36229/g.69451  ORF Transcript_36229/g.69451 Transcript_36229/m.69451 type:complete len:207 (-) Transcript_36229:5585-6205(-)
MEGNALRELHAELGLDELRHGVGQPVGPQRAEQQQLIEVGELLPVSRHGLRLGPLQLHPLLPALGRPQDVVGQCGVHFDFLDGLDRRPHRVRDPLGQGVVPGEGFGSPEEVVELHDVKLALLLEDGHHQLRGHNDLVALEQARGDVRKRHERGVSDEQLDALFHVHHPVQALVLRHLFLGRSAGCLVHSLFENVHEIRHAVLIDAV